MTETETPDGQNAAETRLATRFARYRRLNERRLLQARAAMSAQARRVLLWLPLLLHYNDPALPGYREGPVPCGIDGFAPDAKQQELLRGAGFSTVLPAADAGAAAPGSAAGQRSGGIYALYAMGSTSSIGQGPHSDLDVWVCVGAGIPEAHLRLLIAKCRFISRWAAARQTSLNLFVTEADRFITSRHGRLDPEDCGSAQSLFLLDEFYRTSIRLCGRYICWYLLSAQEEVVDYDGAVSEIQRLLPVPEGWFDFGPVTRSSPREYFGSGLWLLYKAIDSPFKAALKILLMEAYSREYPHTQMLAVEIRQRCIVRESQGALSFDAYFLMYRRVSAYLRSVGDHERLELVRVCFYMKLSQAMAGMESRMVTDVRLRLLRRMTDRWNWHGRFTALLKNPERWKIGYTTEFDQRLFALLRTSYQALLDFSVRHGIEYAITSEDAGVLSRKLYAVFDRSPGKIRLFRSAIFSMLAEPYLTFVHVGPGGVCQEGWHLYPASPGAELLHTPVAYVCQSLCQSVAFACINGILTPRTRCRVFGLGSFSLDRIQDLAERLRSGIGANLRPADELELQRPMEVRRCAVILNLEQDPTAGSLIADQDGMPQSTLSFSSAKVCLAGSVDVVSLDSWGQITVQSLPAGEHGVAELMALLVRYFRPVASTDFRSLVSRIEICSFAAQLRERLRLDIEAVIRQVFACAGHFGRSFVFGIGGNSYVARGSADRGVSVARQGVLGIADYDISVLSRYSMRPENARMVPAVVDRFATYGVVQYFFAPAELGWDIYIVDERNEVRIYRGFQGSRAELVNSINQFYTRQSQTGQTANFNLPQYFVLDAARVALHPFAISDAAAPAA